LSQACGNGPTLTVCARPLELVHLFTDAASRRLKADYPLMRKILVGLLILIAAGIGFVSFSWYNQRHGGEPFGAPFTLTDQKGQTITEQAFRGQPSAVFFGFTHCPEVCPTTLYEMAGYLDTLGDDASNVRAYFVSVDPERDTPEIMNTYISNFSDRI